MDPFLGVYDDRFRVPLVFLGCKINSDKIINQQVRSIDIFPTIANIINLEDKNMDVRGENLLPLIHGEHVEELPVMVESASNSPKSSTSNVIGIRTSKYKYFRDRINSKINVSLFDLISDPLEEEDISKLRPNVVDEMEQILYDICDNKNFNFEIKSSSIDSEENKIIEDELKKLGYI
jgi:arylsulfatase A-like enzyme